MAHTSLAKFNNFSLASIFLTKLKKKTNIISFWYSVFLYIENSYIDLENTILDFNFETNFCALQLSFLELFTAPLPSHKLLVLNSIFDLYAKTAFKVEENIIKEASRQIPAPLKLNNSLNISKQSFLLFSKGLLFKTLDFFDKYSDAMSLKSFEKKNILQNFCLINEQTKNFFYNFSEFNYSNLISQNFSKIFNLTYNDFLAYFVSVSGYETTQILKNSKLFNANSDSDRQFALNFYKSNYITSTKYSSLDLLNESNSSVFIFGSVLHDTIIFKQSIEALSSLQLIKQTFFFNYLEACSKGIEHIDFFPDSIFEANNLDAIENNKLY